MEIISYVGYNNKNYKHGFEHYFRQIAYWLSEKRQNFSRGKEAKSSFKTGISTFPKENVVSARPRTRVLTFKDFLIANGKFVDSIERNAKKIAVTFISLATAFCFVFTASKIVSNAKNHANPLVFQDQASEMELLDSIMKSFASEDSTEYFADGFLVDSDFQTDISKILSEPVTFQTYTVKNGDTISGITRKFGLKNISTIIGINEIENVRLITSGTKLKIPSVDGLIYTVQSGNTLQGLSVKYNVSVEELLDVNELESADLKIGQKLFIPGARMTSDALLNALGELFKMPIYAKFRYSSMFGPRLDPITGAKSSHTGVDMACPQGTPIYSSSMGTVAFVGYSNIFGNYVIVNHANGYQTLYGHMSQILAKKGQKVSNDTKIGLVGSTGYSTGPHLHFTIYKNGRLVDPMTVLKK